MSLIFCGGESGVFYGVASSSGVEGGVFDGATSFSG